MIFEKDRFDKQNDTVTRDSMDLWHAYYSLAAGKQL
jgi:hypothetical protein